MEVNVLNTNRTWILQKDEQDNDVAALLNFVRLLNVQITGTALRRDLERHPNFPSLKATLDTLKHWDFDAVAYKADRSHLLSLTHPAIAYLDGEKKFVVVTEYDHDQVYYLDPARGWVAEPVEAFCTRWKGILLSAVPGAGSVEEDFEARAARAERQSGMQLAVDCVYVITGEGREDVPDARSLPGVGAQTEVVWIDGAGEADVEQALRSGAVRLYPGWLLPESPNPWWNRPMHTREIAAALNHLAAWRKALVARYDTVLVLEANCTGVVDNLSAVARRYAWDLFLLNRNKILPDQAEFDDDVVAPGYSYCQRAYLLTRQGVETLNAAGFEKNLIPVPEFLSALFCDHPRKDLPDLYRPGGEPLKAVTLRYNAVAAPPRPEADPATVPPDPGQATARDLFRHKELCATRPESFDAWAHQFLDPMILNGEYDLAVDEVAPNVYKFPLFTPKFCNLLIEETELRNGWTNNRHKHYPTYDVTLKKMGMHRVYTEAMNRYVMPLAMHLWTLAGDEWTQMKADNFVVKYHPDKRAYLSPHHDGSDVTVNVCLNNAYTGGGTVFPKYKTVVNVTEPGTAIIHPGMITHYHGARPIVDGTRYILVSFLKRSLRAQ